MNTQPHFYLSNQYIVRGISRDKVQYIVTEEKTKKSYDHIIALMQDPAHNAKVQEEKRKYAQQLKKEEGKEHRNECFLQEEADMHIQDDLKTEQKISEEMEKQRRSTMESPYTLRKLRN